MFRILVKTKQLFCFSFLFFIFSYIVTVPIDSGDLVGIVYVWIGGLVHNDDALLAQEIANDMYNVRIDISRLIYMTLFSLDRILIRFK